MNQPPPTTAPAQQPSPADRRAHTRIDVARPAKVFLSRAQRYVPAKTLNVSVSGALVEMQSERLPAEGESVALAIAWSDAVVLPPNSLVEAKVVRRTAAGDKVILALVFTAAQAIAAPAHLKAAA